MTSPIDHNISSPSGRDAGRRQKSHYADGSKRAGNGADPALVMKHKANSMTLNTSKPNAVWYVNSGASNHMTSHEEWFSYLEKPESRRVVETGDDTPHTIEHVGEVPLSHVGQKGKLMNVLHISTITKNLVSVGQIVDQGMQVRFMHLGCFIKNQGKVIAQGRREGRMFILDRNQTGTELFSKGQKVELDIDLWHKRFGHVNFPRLR